MTEKQIVLNDVVVNYYVIPSSSKAVRTVIFLHGWRSNSQIWLPVLKLLKHPDWQIYALDLPGFGRSQLPDAAWDVSDYAEVLKGLIERFRLTDVCVIGHSFGGNVAVKAAELFPEFVQQLVLVNSSGIRVNSWKVRAIFFLAKIFKPAFALPLLKSLRPRIYHILGADDYLATPELKSTFLNVMQEDLSQSLAEITQRTLIVWGAQDRETPLALGQEFARLIPRSHLVVMQKVGHFSFLDKPEEFVRIISKFIDESI
jgi:pimeloyl-ACP methyl ester carboxylesterase